MKQKGIPFEEGMMLVDIKLCQSITEVPEPEALVLYIETFKRLNNLLRNVIELSEEEERLFTNANLDLLTQKPQFLFTPSGKGFLHKRLSLYEQHYPDLFRTLKVIDGNPQSELKAA